eukprot:11210322-Lingulodinium_polyedra.AAC.1
MSPILNYARKLRQKKVTEADDFEEMPAICGKVSKEWIAMWFCSKNDKLQVEWFDALNGADSHFIQELFCM